MKNIQETNKEIVNNDNVLPHGKKDSIEPQKPDDVKSDEIKSVVEDVKRTVDMGFHAWLNSMKKTMVDLFKEEFQKHSEDYVSSVDYRHLICDLILFYDRIEMILSKNDLSVKANYYKTLQGLLNELTEILERQDIKVICLNGKKLDSQQQKVVSTVQTNIVEEDSMVLKIVRKGFKQGNKILRPEEIIVKKYMGEKEAVL